jgi:phage terminase large subunit GpA-like protein
MTPRAQPDGQWLAGVNSALRPPTRLSLSEWADRFFYLSSESAAEPGRWRTLPYQRGIMDAITDPAVERVTWMKSARVGATKLMNAAIGYHIHQDPCSMLAVQPTVEDAEGYSKEEIAPMLRDCTVLAGLIEDAGASKKSSNTILHKKFPGGLLSMVGANSARGFRRVSRRIVFFDEVDGYPASAGNEGDPISLGIRRTDYFWNRKIVAASTPLVAGASRIEQMFLAGDQRRYHVPCPQCGHMDILVFNEPSDGGRGHWMQWPEGEPENAHFVCSANGCVIEDKDKRAMLEAGEWRAEAPFEGHASFHIWAAYSLSPNATWGQLAAEFLEAKRGGPEKLKTFINTALGETWQERGESPEWERIYQRREPYPIGTVPAGVLFLTAGVDVQKDRFVYEVTGWDGSKENWSVDAGVLMGDTSLEATWAQLDELLARQFVGAEGQVFTIALMGVDSGYNAQQVYAWCRRYPMTRVIACKGMGAKARVLVGVPTPVDITVRGKRMQRGYKVWPIGEGLAKSELYGWLRHPVPIEGEDTPPGYCHFPEYDPEYFKQLTAEHLVTVAKRGGYTALEWAILPNRENHWLDCRVLNRVAAAVLGLDRLARAAPAKPAAPPRQAKQQQPREQSPPRPSEPKPRTRGGWLAGNHSKGWLGRRK